MKFTFRGLVQVPAKPQGVGRSSLVTVQKAVTISRRPFLCAMLERDKETARVAVAAIPAEGLQYEATNLLNPRGWYAGLAAMVFGDADGARAAFTEARGVLEQVVQHQPEYAEAWSQLGLVDAGLDRKDEAVAEGRRACELRSVAADALSGPMMIQNLAQIYAWTGDKDRALQQLRLAATLPYGTNYGELKLHPQWDSLRGDPRFEQIVASLAPKQ